MNRDFREPDFFVALDVDGSRSRQGWVVWEEDGRYPDVIVELLSSSTANVDRGVKKRFVRTGVPHSRLLHLRSFCCRLLAGMALGIRLRFYDREGNLVLLPEEIAAREQQQAASERQRAETERQRAERLAQKLRELGEDLDLV